MKASFYFPIYLVVYLVGLVQCLNPGNATAPSTTRANSCILDGAISKCRFNAKSLNLNAESSITITVKEGGRNVRCNNTLIRESTWYGVCDGDADDASFVRSEYSGIEEVIGFIRVIICIHRKEFKPESIEISIKKISSKL